MNSKADKVKKVKTKEKFDITAGILLTLCASFMLFIYAPYELYFTNQQDFWFIAKDLILPTFAFFAVLFAAGTAAFAVARLIGSRVYYIMLACGLVATVATYIQGTFLVSGIPYMDGTAYDWNQFSIERIKCIAVWVILSAAMVFICLKFKLKTVCKAAKYISISLLIMLSVSLVSIIVSNPDKDYNTEEYLKCTDYNQFEMSSDTNLLVFIIDAVDNTTFRNAIEKNPEFSETFEDFTYYNNVLGGYIFTVESIPFMLSGDWYENDESFVSYQNNALDNSPLIKTLEDNGYKIGLYGDFSPRLDIERFEGRFENFVDCGYRFADLKAVTNVIVRMAGLRYAPWDLKQIMIKLPDYVDEASEYDVDYSEYSTDNGSFYNKITEENPIYLTDEKCCRIIHVNGAHVPHQYDKAMNWINNASEATYFGCVEGCITMCDAYIDCLKESGVYDNTAIVIISDHGYDQIGQPHIGRANPILLVKGIDEHHEMKFSEAPISHEDYAQAFSKLAEGNKSDEIFAYVDGDERERRIMIYTYMHDDYIEEYTTTGRADEFDLLQPTGEVYQRNNP